MELDLTYDKDNYSTILENINSKLLTKNKTFPNKNCPTIYIKEDNEE